MDLMEMIMSTISSAPAGAHVTRGQTWPAAIAAVKRWWAAYMAWRIEQAAIITLSAMSDRELKDIGLTRPEITNAVQGVRAMDRTLISC